MRRSFVSRLIAFFVLGACLPITAAAPAGDVAIAKPKVRDLRLDLRVEAGQLVVTGYFRATGSADSVRPYAAASGQASQQATVPASVTSYSFAFTPPAPGATLGGSYCVSGVKGKTASAAICKPWSYTDSTPPSAVLDSLKVTPTSATVSPGAVVPYQATLFYADGRRAVVGVGA